MKSPFPGMDPYLEEHWGDVHHRFIIYSADLLQEELPSELRARVEERVFVDAAPPVRRKFVPGVRVFESPSESPQAASGAAGTAIAEPLVIQFADDPMTQGIIEIIDVKSRGRVVTVIEVLSPSNKYAGEGQDLCLQKQAEVRSSGASLVEIDLVRGGRRVLLAPESKVPPPYRTPYRVCVFRGWKPLQVEVYAAPLRQRLPAIGVPLRENDPDARLDLQAILDLCYEKGRYDDIDYGAPLDTPLDEDDARWTDELLRGAGRR